MAHVEVEFTHGALRQPGLWGKFLLPGKDEVYDVPMTVGENVAVKEYTRKVTLPNYPDGGLLLFGARGYLGAGALSACYALFQVQTGSACDWQFPRLMTRFEGRGVQLLVQTVDDLKPIYTAVEAAGGKQERLREALRQQGIDRQPQ
jgi:hypothetical protein